MAFFDQFGNLTPDQTQGLLAAASQILQQSGPSRTPTSLGQILGGGLQAYQQGVQGSQDRAYQSQLRGLNLQEVQDTASERKRKRDLEQAINSAALASVRDPAAAALANGGGPTVANADAMAQSPGGFDSEGFINRVRAVDPLRAAEFERQFAKSQPEFDTKINYVNGPDGRPVAVIVNKAGQVKTLEGLTPREKKELVNLGGYEEALNLYDVQPGQRFQRTQSPDSAASVAATIRGQNMTDARARQDQAGGGKAPAGYRWTAAGELEAIPGGPATKSAVATEGERKAATLLRRLEGSEAQLQTALGTDAKADKPGILTQGLRTIGAESAANILTPAARQRVEAAQLDILDAALTLGTGAAYTREQLEGYRRSYFPQIGDDPSTVSDKQARLRNVIDSAKIAAGRAAPTGTSAPKQSGGWSIQRVGD